MSPARLRVFLFLAFVAAPFAASATNLVTGNGFGFAVVEPGSARLTRFYAHPYSFARPDPKDALGEGLETTNFVKRLAWSGEAAGVAAEYERDSHVLHARSSAGEGFVFMPFGLERCALILDWEPGSSTRSGAFHVEWAHRVRESKQATVAHTVVRLVSFEGVDESLVLVPLARASAAPDEREPLAASHAWALISIENESELDAAVRELLRWRGALTVHALAEREVAQLERWRVQPAVEFRSQAEKRLWRQSEVMLRMAQSREPNRADRHGNGMIAACLPDGVFATPWVRDMAYAAMALNRMGHRAEARAALVAYFNAQPTGLMKREVRGADYQVSVVRYFGDGTEEPFFTMEGSTNIEYDNWGEVLVLLGDYLARGPDPALLRAATYRGPLYESARDFVVKPLLANAEPFGEGLIMATDTSIWEERQRDAKHFAFSTAAAIAGLRAFAPVAREAHDETTRALALERAEQLEKGFNAAFVRGGLLHGTLEEGIKNDIDGALLAAINLGAVTDRALLASTVERMEQLKVVSGGYRRVHCILTDQKIYEYWYEREEFVFTDFSLAEVLRRLGRHAEADRMVARLVEKAAADHNTVPEMYVAVPCELFPGAIGDPTGARPMAGYGAGAYILHLIERERLARVAR